MGVIINQFLIYITTHMSKYRLFYLNVKSIYWLLALLSSWMTLGHNDSAFFFYTVCGEFLFAS